MPGPGDRVLETSQVRGHVACQEMWLLLGSWGQTPVKLAGCSSSPCCPPASFIMSYVINQSMKANGSVGSVSYYSGLPTMRSVDLVRTLSWSWLGRGPGDHLGLVIGV